MGGLKISLAAARVNARMTQTAVGKRGKPFLVQRSYNFCVIYIIFPWIIFFCLTNALKVHFAILISKLGREVREEKGHVGGWLIVTG